MRVYGVVVGANVADGQVHVERVAEGDVLDEIVVLEAASQENEGFGNVKSTPAIE